MNSSVEKKLASIAKNLFLYVLREKTSKIEKWAKSMNRQFTKWKHKWQTSKKILNLTSFGGNANKNKGAPFFRTFD